MSIHGQFKQGIRQTMVAGVPTPLASGSFKSLAPEQLGLFAVKEDGTIGIASGSETNAKFLIAQGIKKSPTTGLFFSKTEM